MTEEQNKTSDTVQQSPYSIRAQERHERRMAKQAAQQERMAAREARRAAHAQRVHRDWTFEMKLGEKVYTFNWRWHPQEPEPVEETIIPPSQVEAVENEMPASDSSQ
jgi:hypothetical protein